MRDWDASKKKKTVEQEEDMQIQRKVKLLSEI